MGSEIYSNRYMGRTPGRPAIKLLQNMYIARPTMSSGRRGRRPLQRLRQFCFRVYAIRSYKSHLQHHTSHFNPTGNVTINVVPLFNLLSTSIFPPDNSTILFAIVIPIPAPGFVCDLST